MDVAYLLLMWIGWQPSLIDMGGFPPSVVLYRCQRAWWDYATYAEWHRDWYLAAGRDDVARAYGETATWARQWAKWAEGAGNLRGAYDYLAGADLAYSDQGSGPGGEPDSEIFSAGEKWWEDGTMSVQLKELAQNIGWANYRAGRVPWPEDF